MQYKFHAYGHQNILGTHKATLEFTKDEEVSLKGDCIVGVNADFELKDLKEFIKGRESKKVSITIETSDRKIKESIAAEMNPEFNSSHELVIRKTDFISERTLAIRANKAAFELNKELIGFLKEKRSKINVIIENKD